MNDFISSNDLNSFEGYLKYQAIDPTTLSAEALEEWRGIYVDAMARRNATPKIGFMKLPQDNGDERYAVAIRDGVKLWLTLWVRCSARGDVYIFVPRGNRDWNPHASYHADGTFHHKSYDVVVTPVTQKRQSPVGAFKGTECLGKYMGHGTGNAECDPAAYSGVFELAPGILGPRNGAVEIDLVEPGMEGESLHESDVIRQVFARRNGRPSIVITVSRN
jgi:hypothetical protein